ncbi:MAG: sulfatase-like hydrolase/transferase [Saprospiraceae bacterium]
MDYLENETKDLSQSIRNIFGILFFSYLLFQFEITVHFFLENDPNLSSLFTLLSYQKQNVIFSALISLLFLFFYQGKSLRYFYFFLVSFFVGYILLDHIFYSFFLDHYQFNIYQETGDLSFFRMIDSIWANLNSWNLINLIWFVFCLFFLRRNIIFTTNFKIHHPFQIQNILTVGIILLFLIIGKSEIENNNLPQHPIFSLTKSAFRESSTSSEKFDLDKNIDIYSLQFGESYNNTEEENGIIDYQTNYVKTNKRQPNIIYVLLESVGAINMFPEGKLDESVSPNLARLQKHGIIFPKIYNTFPGSERSHIPISTGGVTFTWGKSKSEGNYEYTGTTLVDEFKLSNYRTGLFSAMFMDTENFLDIYLNLPFDEKFIPDFANAEFTKKNRLNSWGLKDETVFEKAKEWIAKQEKDQSYFAQILNISTHHPYYVPEDFPNKFNNTELGRYKNTIRYVDQEIGELVEFLATQDLLENTIVVVSGDHGEAFGKRHQNNILHKHHIYEENVRNFFLTLDFRMEDGPRYFHRNGFIGDIMPSILGVANISPKEVPGQNLFEENYEQRIHFFYKNSHPEKLGLVDGKWKFITRKIGNKSPEIYDLENDPTEQNNLANLHPNKVEKYYQLCVNWFVQKNENFERNLKGFKEEERVVLTPLEITSPGPKKLSFGKVDASGVFTNYDKITQNTRFEAYTVVIPYSETTPISYVWKLPDGTLLSQTIRYSEEWTKSWVKAPFSFPREVGEYELSLYLNDSLLIKNNFTISE